MRTYYLGAILIIAGMVILGLRKQGWLTMPATLQEYPIEGALILGGTVQLLAIAFAKR